MREPVSTVLEMTEIQTRRIAEGGPAVMFERATLDFDSARGADALRVDEEGQPSRVVKSEGPDGYGGELRHMIQAIQSGQPPAVVTAQDGLSAVEICEAEEKSVNTGQVVSL